MASGAHFIPRPDGDFSAWADQFETQANAFLDGLGISNDLTLELKAALMVWREAYPAHIAAQAAAESARTTKDEARRAVEAVARPLAAFLQTLPDTTDANRAAIGITVRGTPTLRVGSLTSAPRTQIGAAARLQHTLRLTDSATPTRKAKPPGVLGAEVWIALTDSHETTPPPESAYRYATLTTRDQCVQTFTTAARGKTAWYQLRWRTTRGQTGPWGEIASATVAA